eukprot:m.30985 g.30985  ORF g.30985 m.30985 type:complete len:105 (-) comp12024_c0_seq1:637-951(-)
MSVLQQLKRWNLSRTNKLWLTATARLRPPTQQSPFYSTTNGSLDETSENKPSTDEEATHPKHDPPAAPPQGHNVDDFGREINGPKGPEPTRYGDWERKGRVSDF